jgi:hypothetical protein
MKGLEEKRVCACVRARARACVKFCFKLGKNFTEAFNRLTKHTGELYEPNAML